MNCVSVRGCEFIKCRVSEGSKADGGAIHVECSGEMIIQCSGFRECAAVDLGGALLAPLGVVVLANSWLRTGSALTGDGGCGSEGRLSLRW